MSNKLQQIIKFLYKYTFLLIGSGVAAVGLEIFLIPNNIIEKVSRAPWKLVRRRITPNIFRYHKITQFCCSKLLRIGSPASQKE